MRKKALCNEGLGYHSTRIPRFLSASAGTMKFCSNCGAPVTVKVPTGDNLPRHVCDACSTIHYSNPKMVIGCIPEWEGRVLLCKRAIEPRSGLWTLPAGFMENGETTAQAALRETFEEANARVELAEMFTVLSVPYVNQVHIFYRGRLLDLDFGPGTESLEVALFREEEIPWREIAFRTVSLTLEHFYADRRTGSFGIHAGDIHPKR
jgi:ADP-ribose pyrophosphatase YjhB (NUDIX family)